MGNNRFAGFDKLTIEEQTEMMRDYLEEQVKIFIVGTSSFNEQNASFKAIAVSSILFHKLKEISKDRNVSFSKLTKEMLDKAFKNYNGQIMDYTAYFLKALDYQSESEKLATACDFAWNSAVQLMPYMKESTNYNCPNNPYMLYALNMIGVKRIISAQEFVDSKTNRINPYQLSSFKKEFERYFTEALNNNLQIEQIEGSGSLVKEIAAPKPNQALLGSPDSPLKALNEDVKRIGENVMPIIEGRG